ncbi:MAG: hypothetical protein ACYC6Y_26705, partial [Thermoguttaceae bacterium]
MVPENKIGAGKGAAGGRPVAWARRAACWTAAVAVLLLPAWSGPQACRAAEAAAPAGDLAERQRLVAEKFERLEQILLRMSELTAASDPGRAALLTKAVAESKERLI